MNFFLQYLIKLSISLALVYLFYQLILRKLTFYNHNRWYLLGYSFLSFFIAFINISPVLEKNELANASVIRWVPVIYYDATGDSTAASSAYNFFTAWNIISVVFVAGMLIMLIRLLIQFVSFHRMMGKAELISDGRMKLYQVNDSIIPFSFGGSIFINRHLHSEDELQEIIRHEFVHVRQHHSMDIIWSEVLCLLNWYNPFAWLLKRSIRQNLEFIADNKVLENGVNKKEYQYLLLKVIGNNQYSIATPFNFSSLKKRIAMMNKLRSAKVNLLRFLFVLPLLAVILVSFRKEIGDTLRHKSPGFSLPVKDFTDTVPEVRELNSKGYFIDIKGKDGNCIVVVKDKENKEVKQVLLTDWNEKPSYYSNLYGEIPPPPPPVPAAPPVPPVERVEGTPLPMGLTEVIVAGMPLPPTPPTVVKLPDNVEKININNNKAKITLKDGKEESYNLDKPAEKKQFESKYGKIVETPLMPTEGITPVATGMNSDQLNLTRISSEFEITDKKAVIKLKNGAIEKYDLTDKKERKDFESKYGKLININRNTNTVVGTVPSINSNTTLMPSVLSTNGVNIIATSPILSGNPIASTVIAPARTATGGLGTTVIAPMAADEGVIIADDYGYTITGKEDILVVINRKTTRQELEENIKNMKKVGVELSYDDIEYNSKGELIAISGTMKTADGRSNFVANDFSTLILAMIRKGEKTYFKVSTTDRKQVI
ncbi:MAG TPA: M56 family metallopeptidase [Chitinophagaceae bacterium]|nr:M56 family metallopeptidase [Chitinophagaceae bacterium]